LTAEECCSKTFRIEDRSSGYTLAIFM
jgi:hypothetical protein